MDERKRDSIVAYLLRRMAEFNITPDAIVESFAADQRRLLAVKYRDAFGNSWDGEGAAPQWVVQATSAGQSLEHFAAHQSDAVQENKRPTVDWRNDPFAGSRLAKERVEQPQAF